MARGQGHVGDIADIPRRHNQPARVGVALYFLDHLRQLVDVAAARLWP